MYKFLKKKSRLVGHLFSGFKGAETSQYDKKSKTQKFSG